MDTKLALDRLTYTGSTDPVLSNLQALQLAFLYSVPFENLDIHLGREIRLDPERIYRKIVEEKRGGFCYECNTLFHALLGALGFEVRFAAAKMISDTALDSDFNHMVLVVNLDEGEFLVDVGNGQSCLQPMRLHGEDEAQHEGIEDRLGEYEDRLGLFFRSDEQDWTVRFSFTSVSRQTRDFVDICQLTQQSPDSLFTQNRIVTLALPDGRLTLAGRELEEKRAGRNRKRVLESTQELQEVLAESFGIHLDSIPSNW